MKSASNESCSHTESRQFIESLASVPKYPRRPFLLEGVTFEQLYGRAQNIRDQFNRDLSRTTPICLCTEDRAHVTAALLAALGGGPPLMLPYAFSRSTLEEACESIPYAHALVEKRHDLPAGVQAFTLPESSLPEPNRSEQRHISWDAPWLYLFTGGSTGTPQIWSKTPRNLLMEAAYLARAFKITPNDIVLATAPPYHIYGLLYSVLLPLVSGASVSIFTPSFPNEIVQRLLDTQATVLVSLPAHYRALKKTAIPGHHVHTAFSSAGALDEQDGLDFYNTTGIGITEIYGSTETGGIARRNRSAGQTAFHPFACVDVKVKNEHLWVRSDFLSKELARDEEGFFGTADRAAWSDGTGFSILGRSDGIVKVAGKRVDLAKTRETLLQVTGVREVYVFAMPVQSGRENEIVALVEGRVRVEQLAQAASLHLPHYARPRNVKIIERIPLSPTGKYNHEAIKKLFSEVP